MEGSSFYTWLVGTAWQILKAGRIVGPLPEHEPEVADVRGGGDYGDAFNDGDEETKPDPEEAEFNGPDDDDTATEGDDGDDGHDGPGQRTSGSPAGVLFLGYHPIKSWNHEF